MSYQHILNDDIAGDEYNNKIGMLEISDLPEEENKTPRKALAFFLGIVLIAFLSFALLLGNGESSYEWADVEVGTSSSLVEEGSSADQVQGGGSSTFSTSSPTVNPGDASDAPSDPDGRGENHETMKAQYFPEAYYDGTAPDISSKALCNNRDKGIYWMTEGSETKNYAIYFPGGASCQDAESCSDRNETRPEDMEGPSEEELEEGRWGRGLTQNGDFNEEYINPFLNYNLVELHYCSSDSFIGRMDQNDTRNLAPDWHFGGDAMVWGMFRGLLNEHNLAEAENIFITSSSAGAAGIFQQMDRIIDYLKVEAPNAKVKFAYDNGWHLHGVPTSAEWNADDSSSDLLLVDDDESLKKDQLTCWNPNMNEHCISSQPEGEEFMCFYTGNMLYDYLANQVFWVHLHEFDQKGYGSPTDMIELWDDARFEYSIWLAGVMVDSLIATDETLTSFTLPASRTHDSFDKPDWVQEYMPMTQHDETYWDDYEEEGVPDDAVLLGYYMKSYVDDEFPTPVRVYDACLYPYCNPTSARLPLDVDWDPDATEAPVSSDTLLN